MGLNLSCQNISFEKSDKIQYPRGPTDPMPIDYIAESDKYRPDNSQTLLVGEAPPPNRTSYIYVPENMRNAQNVQNDRSLPATIFNHYFGRRPADKNEYRDFLLRLKKLGVFIVDIYDQPIKVRNNQKGLEKIVVAIPKLRGKLRDRGILVDEKRMIFLLARKNYTRQIRENFPNAKLVRWIDFRMDGSDL